MDIKEKALEWIETKPEAKYMNDVQKNLKANELTEFFTWFIETQINDPEVLL